LVVSHGYSFIVGCIDYAFGDVLSPYSYRTQYGLGVNPWEDPYSVRTLLCIWVALRLPVVLVSIKDVVVVIVVPRWDIYADPSSVTHIP